MKKIKFLAALMIGLVTSAFVGVPLAGFLALNPLAVTGGIALAPLAIKVAVTQYYGFMPNQTSGFAFMAVQKENWVDYILGNLFKDNEFLKKCYREDDSVLNGTVVHIPQAGSKPVVIKNRTLLPGVAVQRTDTDVTYPLDWYTTNPTVITNAEEKEVSYDKMSSVIGEHVEVLNDTLADDILYKWAPTTSATIIRTTGVADGVALAPVAAGTRKALLAKDLRIAQATMNKAGISRTERYALIPEDMMTQLMADTTLTGSQIQLLLDAKEGKVVKLFGFEIMTRVHAGVYDNTGTPVPKTPETAGATTDNLCVLCWQKNAVALAQGTVDFFENKQDATYYGDVYSAGVRCGGRKRRSDAAGVIAIVQTT
jgi:hypothetical protein